VLGDDGFESYCLQTRVSCVGQGKVGVVPRGFRETGEMVSSFVRGEVFLVLSVEETILGIREAYMVVPFTKEDSVDVVILKQWQILVEKR
jgi:hypothetical protein